MLKRLVRTATVLAVAAAGLVVGTVTEPAAADPPCGVGTTCGGGTSSGNGTVVVHVSGSFVGSGSGGYSGSTSVTVPTPCWYTPGFTGKEYYEWVESGQAQSTWYHQGGEGPFVPHPGYKQHKDDDEGHWYGSVCSSETFENLDDFFEFADEWFETHDAVYVEAGGSPPIPPIPGEVLLAAAMEALTIPEPEFGYDPDLDETGGTVVNLDTWFWLADDIPLEGSVTAQAGPWSATVDLGLSNVEYHSDQAGTVVCEDGGTEWSPGAESDCTLSFARPADAETVTANARWDGTWSFNGVEQGSIDPLTASWETSFPVIEIGSTVEDVG